MTSEVTSGLAFDTKIFLTKLGANFHRNTQNELPLKKDSNL